MGGIEKMVVAGDWQVPFEDEHAVGLLYQFLRDYQPDIVVLNGDIIDCWEISDYDKVPELVKIDEEIEATKSYLKELRGLCPSTRIVYVEGNHEFRWRKAAIRSLLRRYIRPLPELFSLDSLNIEWVGTSGKIAKFKDTYFIHKGLYVGHFEVVRKWSGFSAKGIMDSKYINFITNHNHRIGYHCRSTIGGRTLVGVENGCLCSFDTTYIVDPDWQVGWSLVEFWKNEKEEDQFQIHPILIQNGQFEFGGKIYS